MCLLPVVSGCWHRSDDPLVPMKQAGAATVSCAATLNVPPQHQGLLHGFGNVTRGLVRARYRDRHTPFGWSFYTRTWQLSNYSAAGSIPSFSNSRFACSPVFLGRSSSRDGGRLINSCIPVFASLPITPASKVYPVYARQNTIPSYRAS